MKRSKTAILVYLIVGLAVIGLFSQLFGNTKNFLLNIFVMIGVAVIIFGVFYYFISRKRGTSDETKKYKQAVKQSKQKYQQNPSPGKGEDNPRWKKTTKSTAINRKGKKRATHLRVIEGNKSKGKDRATF
ncbi:SA1362 family protein [Oceanobacillus sp. FSL H7-0719]|uniref:SA1362 family protein n=1 Tax=Oceanobacillus sp. FSL H7-0719 TaxID=2954507 RepID=UPI003244E003